MNFVFRVQKCGVPPDGVRRQVIGLATGSIVPLHPLQHYAAFKRTNTCTPPPPCPAPPQGTRFPPTQGGTVTK